MHELVTINTDLINERFNYEIRSDIFLILRRNERVMIINVYCSSDKVPVILLFLVQTEQFITSNTILLVLIRTTLFVAYG